MKSGACDMFHIWLSFAPSPIFCRYVTSLDVCVCVCSLAPLICRQITRLLKVMKAGTVKNTTWVPDLVTIRGSLPNCTLSMPIARTMCVCICLWNCVHVCMTACASSRIFLSLCCYFSLSTFLTLHLYFSCVFLNLNLNVFFLWIAIRNTHTCNTHTANSHVSH